MKILAYEPHDSEWDQRVEKIRELYISKFCILNSKKLKLFDTFDDVSNSSVPKVCENFNFFEQFFLEEL